MRSKFFLTLAVSILFAMQCFAQVYHGRITGLVTDQSGAAVPGATVTVENVNTGIKSTVKTNATGVYIVGSLIPGKYTVKVDMTGFSGFTQENVNVEVASGARAGGHGGRARGPHLTSSSLNIVWTASRVNAGYSKPITVPPEIPYGRPTTATALSPRDTTAYAVPTKRAILRK